MNDGAIPFWRRYRWLLTGVFVVVVVGWWIFYPCWRWQDTTVILVRHAEKVDAPGDPNPPLAPEGEERAAELARVLGLVDFSRIYVTSTIRTQRTAEDLAADLGITPVVKPPAASDEVVSEIRSGAAGRRVLVVGHSNTVPEMIEDLGGGTIPVIEDDIYDNLFVLTLCRCRWGGERVMPMKYGARGGR